MANSKAPKEIKYQNPDLDMAFKTIVAKRQPYDLLYAYYRGNQPLKYSTERLRKAFDKIGTYFAQNWIAVVVDAVLDRLMLKGFDVTDKTASDALENIWEEYNMQLLADDVHEAATVVSEGYVIAWKEDAVDEGSIGDSTITDVYFNDPRMCHVFYDPYRPTQKLYAAKLWVGADYYPRMMLYYPDRLEHYKSVSQNKATDVWIGSASNFRPDTDYGEDGSEPNPYDKVPVFHFRSGRVSGKREIGQSEISLQDAINKLFADMMVASEFTTWKQRVIISQADPGDLKNQAGTNWWIPAGDGKGQAAGVTEIGGDGLDNYMGAIDRIAQSLAIISRTPKHYLMLNGADPSGDALLAMEAPLNKKVKKREEGYAVEWQALAQFLLELEGIIIDKKDITPVWEPVGTTQPLTSAQTVAAEVGAGVPLLTSLRREGWGKDEIQQLEDDRKADDTRRSGLAQDALDRIRAMDAQNNTNPDGTPKTPAGNKGGANG